ncbi:hypothetical protein [Alkalicoccus chagannorensis]|uniref:hypothetical protein n=1 Tax=Alkalicoccus chagannorensis TaxID=427072 RepID=UPI0004075063|nr:hypothetical protein [Alkalicoccus chagannorensis]
MDEMIVQINGAVKHPVMIDPGVWIFDERRLDMDTVFDQPESSQKERDFSAMGKAFDEQRMQGAGPQSNQNKVTISKKDLTEKSLGIGLKPFFHNAEPEPDAAYVHLVQDQPEEDIILPLEEAMEGIAAFSHKGSPLKEDGPLHFYYRDGSNRTSPVTRVKGFTLLKEK